MKRSTSLLGAASLAVLLAACADERDSDTPTASLEATAPRAASSVAATDSTSEVTTLPDDAAPICLAYLERRNLYKARLAQAPDNADLRELVSAYNEFLGENCR